MGPPHSLLSAAEALVADLRPLNFAPPVTHVYNPLIYARRPAERYLERFGKSPKRVVFLGMNPGPFGMAQTGVPFGEIAAVRDWMGIEEPVERPDNEHPKRRVEGFACPRSEVSGRRLWGLFAQRYPRVDAFFEEHFVANFCPLVFMEATGRNRTPDKLRQEEREAVYRACDAHLARVLLVLRPEWLIGVGEFAAKRGEEIAASLDPSIRVGRVLHPSPASPAANRGWSRQAEEQLRALGVW